MKTSIACRLSTSLAVTAAVIFSFTGCKDNPVNEKPGTPENDDKDTVEITAPFPEKAISDYFKSALKGEDTLFNEYHVMKDYGSIGENRKKYGRSGNRPMKVFQKNCCRHRTTLKIRPNIRGIFLPNSNPMR